MYWVYIQCIGTYHIGLISHAIETVRFLCGFIALKKSKSWNLFSYFWKKTQIPNKFGFHFTDQNIEIELRLSVLYNIQSRFVGQLDHSKRLLDTANTLQGFVVDTSCDDFKQIFQTVNFYVFKDFQFGRGFQWTIFLYATKIPRIITWLNKCGRVFQDKNGVLFRNNHFWLFLGVDHESLVTSKKKSTNNNNNKPIKFIYLRTFHVWFVPFPPRHPKTNSWIHWIFSYRVKCCLCWMNRIWMQSHGLYTMFIRPHQMLPITLHTLEPSRKLAHPMRINWNCRGHFKCNRHEKVWRVYSYGAATL